MTRVRRDEAGAALLFAIGVMVFLGIIAGAMASSVASGLHDRAALDQARTREYAADSGIQQAITQVRQLSDPGPALTGCAPGTHYGPYGSADTPPVQIRVNCSNVFQLTRSGFQQRNVVFNACVESGTDCTDSSSIVRAQVNFQTTGIGSSLQVTRTWVQSWSVNG